MSEVMGYTKEQIKANREAWLTALESGEYTQGTGVLRYNNSFCCLGVACQAVPPVAGIELDSEPASPGSVVYVFGADRRKGVLPWEVGASLGFGTEDPFVRLPGGGIRSLTELNDTLSMTFSEIATVIRAQGDDWDGHVRHGQLVDW